MQAFALAVAELRAADPRVWSLQFQAWTDAHPRIDTHARLAQELADFLRAEVLPTLQRSTS